MDGMMFGGPDMGCGASHESRMEECKEEIKSKDIVSFSYAGTDASYLAKKEDGKVKIACSGGGKYNKRDGSLYGINYETEDDGIFKLLQEIVEKHNVARNNGHCLHVDGLPGGIGDLINIEYASGEKIYKYSNQCITIMPDAISAIDDVFRKEVQKNGLDFNTAGSNVKLFDDADVDYVQGTWTGTHFGSEVVATFDKNHITITIDGKETDNEEFTIIQGNVVSNRLKEGVTEPKDEHDYEYFNGVSCFVKKNWFTMTAYFMQEGYSTCDMHNFDKEKPEDEK